LDSAILDSRYGARLSCRIAPSADLIVDRTLRSVWGASPAVFRVSRIRRRSASTERSTESSGEGPWLEYSMMSRAVSRRCANKHRNPYPGHGIDRHRRSQGVRSFGEGESGASKGSLGRNACDSVDDAGRDRRRTRPPQPMTKVLSDWPARHRGLRRRVRRPGGASRAPTGLTIATSPTRP
jgi:hypothetical protein